MRVKFLISFAALAVAASPTLATSWQNAMIGSAARSTVYANICKLDTAELIKTYTDLALSEKLEDSHDAADVRRLIKLFAADIATEARKNKTTYCAKAREELPDLVSASKHAAPSMPSAEFAKPDPLAGIKADCESEWGTDYAMRKYCIDKQIKAIQWLSKHAETQSPEQAQIQTDCATEWKTPNTYDFTMIKYCVEKQEKALEELKKY